MKMISRHIITLFVFIVCIGSINSYAGCMEFQGVTLCDNGDRQLTLHNTIYTTRDGELSIRQRPDYLSDHYIYSQHHYSHCYREGNTITAIDSCYKFRHYHGDLAGQ